MIAIGHSMGGTIAAVTSTNHNSKISALILIEPGFMPPFWRPWVFLLQKFRLTDFLPFVRSVRIKTNGWKSFKKAKKNILNDKITGKWHRDYVESFWSACLTKSKTGLVKYCCDPKWESRCFASAPWNIWNYVAKVKVPTLVLYGDKSPTFLPQVVKKIKKVLPKAEMVKIKNAGHSLPMEKTETTVHLIFNFLIRLNLIPDNQLITSKKQKTQVT